MLFFLLIFQRFPLRNLHVFTNTSDIIYITNGASLSNFENVTKYDPNSFLSKAQSDHRKLVKELLKDIHPGQSLVGSETTSKAQTQPITTTPITTTTTTTPPTTTTLTPNSQTSSTSASASTSAVHTPKNEDTLVNTGDTTKHTGDTTNKTLLTIIGLTFCISIITLLAVLKQACEECLHLSAMYAAISNGIATCMSTNTEDELHRLSASLDIEATASTPTPDPPNTEATQPPSPEEAVITASTESGSSRQRAVTTEEEITEQRRREAAEKLNDADSFDYVAIEL